jgi:hypothetical protein
MEQFDRITTDITRMNGEPCIRKFRLYCSPLYLKPWPHILIRLN